MRHIVAGLAAFYVGHAVFALGRLLIWGDPVTGQNLGNEYFLMGAFGFFVLLVPVYTLLVMGVERYLPQSNKYVLLPVVCMAIFFIPAFIAIRSVAPTGFTTNEAIQFYLMFLSSGLAYGLITAFFQKSTMNESMYQYAKNPARIPLDFEEQMEETPTPSVKGYAPNKA